MLFSKMIPTFFRPNLERLDFWRMLPGLRPRANDVRGIHRGAFGQQQLSSRDVAFGRRHVQRRLASGSFSPEARRGRCGLPAVRRRRGQGAAGRTTEVVGMLSSRPYQPTKERWMFWSRHLENFSKRKNIHKHIEQLSIDLSYRMLPLMKRCVIENVQRNDKASKNDVFNWVITWSSIRPPYPKIHQQSKSQRFCFSTKLQNVENLLAPFHLPQAIQLNFFLRPPAIEIPMFLVHALRRHAEEVPQGRQFAVPGRHVDTGTEAQVKATSGKICENCAKTWQKHEKLETCSKKWWFSGRKRCFLKKTILIQKGTFLANKNGERNVRLFYFRTFWIDAVVGAPLIPVGPWENDMYQNRRKRSYC